VGRILLVDDDHTVAEVVVRYLELDGFEVEWVADGRAAVDRALADPPDLIVLDLMLPHVDGLEVCRRVRALNPVPVIMLTARSEESDRVGGLDLGADDYVSKPFSPRELVSRVKAVLRRTAGATSANGPTKLEAGDLVVDVPARQAFLRGTPVPLTAREFELLAHLMSHPRRAFRREELMERVWGTRFGDHSTVTVHVRRLREKIEDDPAKPRWVTTVWGVGYRFEP
jgi:DNA-binding response OmpR family regulator